MSSFTLPGSAVASDSWKSRIALHQSFVWAGWRTRVIAGTNPNVSVNSCRRSGGRLLSATRLLVEPPRFPRRRRSISSRPALRAQQVAEHGPHVCPLDDVARAAADDVVAGVERDAEARLAEPGHVVRAVAHRRGALAGHAQLAQDLPRHLALVVDLDPDDPVSVDVAR